MGRNVESVGKPTISRWSANPQRQLGNQHAKKVVDQVHPEVEMSLTNPEEHDLSFDMVRVNYINVDSGKSVTITKLESSMSQGQN